MLPRDIFAVVRSSVQREATSTSFWTTPAKIALDDAWEPKGPRRL